ncbi:helix-turn-helix transcriptional regulator [Mucilaginibacter sp. Bleaf8]|uniref:helix-turn-helix domain-containing protein n=1 Tax=Mucilaginibacter sp. Bleaf8 TaxID=2834430 RepID=UPI001BD00C08|nr:helix-turn-helix transcriptional regulator [Mucilaginibacter sp. Bleaf8]MBS7563773.1 helix-turn-helix transcriptional regulator [Mucilaginibacter sp. Bleaf8]
MPGKQLDSFFENLEVNIRQQAKVKGITLAELAKDIEMTEAGFYKMLSTDSIKLKTLKKIAEVLQMPISYFIENKAKKSAVYQNERFETTVAAEPNTVYRVEKEGLLKQISLLESQLKDKDRIIELLSKK